MHAISYNRVMHPFEAQVRQFAHITLNADQLGKFQQFEDLLLTRNREFNLTAIREPAEIRTKHFLDSLTCWQVMQDSSPNTIIDIGSGAGFPGIPLKIAFPELDVMLVESTGKKVRFCQEVFQSLALTGIRAIQARAEELAHLMEYREKYDWAIARAVAPLPALVEYLLPFVRLGGFVLAQKGATAMQESTDAAAAISVLGGQVKEIRRADLPDGINDHHLIVIQKVSPTPAIHPRSGGLPLKKPIREK